MIRPDRFAELDAARRRDLLRYLLQCGALGSMPVHVAWAGWFSSDPEPLPDGKSIHSLEGDVTVNGQPADSNTRIVAGDTVRTGERSKIIFAVGEDSFLLRGNSELQIEGDNLFVRTLRMFSGRLLSVFGKRQAGESLNLTASTATIGIRGSGVYLESEPDEAYVCTCYGLITLASSADPNDREDIRSKNHDEPRYISRDASRGSRIREAPVINHSNEELELLEAIVGRKVPAGFGKQSYDR